MSLRKSILCTSLGGAIFFLPFSIPLCHAFIGLFLLCWIWEGRWVEKLHLTGHNNLVWPYLIFFLLQLVGVVYSENKDDAWFNVEKKIAILLLPLALGTTLDFDRKDAANLLKVFIASCIIGTVICFAVAITNINASQSNFDGTSLSLFGKLNPESSGRWMAFSYVELASGIDMHPTFLGMYIVFSLMLLYHFYGASFATFSTAKKIGLIALALYFVVFVAFLSSRIVVIALGVLCFACLYALLKDSGKQMGIVMAILGGMILILFIDPVPRYRTIQEPFTAESYAPGADGLYNYSTGIRKSLWLSGINSIGQVNPLWGAGTGDMTATMKSSSEALGTKNIIGSFDPHNEFLYTQIELGAIGLVTLLACLFLPCWPALRDGNYFYTGFTFLFALVCMTESALESQKGIVFFSIFNSILVFQYFRFELAAPKKLAYG